MFGLPDGATACLFDMDGVLTQTALVHAGAWKKMFDDFLRQHAQETGTEFVPFDAHYEYDAYVDGKPRLDGTRSFLQSRGIELPEGSPDDIRTVRQAGIRTAIVSSSANTKQILDSGGRADKGAR